MDIVESETIDDHQTKPEHIFKKANSAGDNYEQFDGFNEWCKLNKVSILQEVFQEQSKTYQVLRHWSKYSVPQCEKFQVGQWLK